MTRIKRIYADFKPSFKVWPYPRKSVYKSDLIRVPLPLVFPVWFRLCRLKVRRWQSVFPTDPGATPV